jgi:hypothetical protein
VTLRITSELADPPGAIEVGEHQDVEQLGARSLSEDVQAFSESAFEFIWTHGREATSRRHRAASYRRKRCSFIYARLSGATTVTSRNVVRRHVALGGKELRLGSLPNRLAVPRCPPTPEVTQVLEHRRRDDAQ